MSIDGGVEVSTYTKGVHLFYRSYDDTLKLTPPSGAAQVKRWGADVYGYQQRTRLQAEAADVFVSGSPLSGPIVAALTQCT